MASIVHSQIATSSSSPNQQISLFVKHMYGSDWIFHVNPTDTVGKIQDLIFEKERIPQDRQKLIFRDVNLVAERRLDDFNIVDTSTLDLQILPPELITLVVQTLTGRQFTFSFKRTTKIIRLKHKIMAQESIPVDLQLLSFNGVFLRDYKKLLDYGIENQSRCDLRLGFNGRGRLPHRLPEFARGMFLKEVSEDVSMWRQIGPGLNLEAFCANNRCIAFDEAIIYNPGFGTFDMQDAAANTLCPLCREVTGKAFNLGFYYCLYSYSGMRREENHSLKSFSGENLPVTPRGYWGTYDGGPYMHEWVYITFSVARLPSNEVDVNHRIDNQTPGEGNYNHTIGSFFNFACQFSYNIVNAHSELVRQPSS